MRTFYIDDRGFYSVEVFVGEVKKVFKVPQELVVAELEMILEFQTTLENSLKENKEKEALENACIQLEVIFKHYQPYVDREWIKDNLTPSEILRLLSIFNDNRFLKQEDSQKKTQLHEKV